MIGLGLAEALSGFFLTTSNVIIIIKMKYEN